LQINNSYSGELFGTVLVIPCLYQVIIFPLFLTLLIIKNKQKIIDDDEKFKKQFGSIFEDLSTKNLFCMLWRVQQLYKMLFTSLVLIYLDQYPMVQLFFLMMF